MGIIVFDDKRLHSFSSFLKFVGFEVFTAVVMKSIIFWDMTLCNPLSWCNSTDYMASYPRR
jgi:branched-subunit amino acid transport protein